MDQLLLARDLTLALAIGLLIGVERGWSMRSEQAGARVAGLRTFGLLGLLGGLAGVVAKAGISAVAALVVAGAIGALGLGFHARLRTGRSVSATSTIVAILALGLGLLATIGLPAIAFASAAVVTLLLASRAQLHNAVRALGVRDVQAIARYAIIAGAILPFLPNRQFGPYGAWNPFELWLVVVIVTGFSFAGYVANRLFGVRYGTLATAAIGGLYSSTAVTVALSRRLRENAGGEAVLSAGIALASAIMFVRALALTAILATSAALPLAMIIGPAALLAIGLGIWMLRKAEPAVPDGAVGSSNPFALLPALGFSLLVAVMALAARWAELRFGGGGIAVLIAIVGAFDVDAAIVTLGGLPEGMVAPALAGLVLAIPIALNSGFKAAVTIAYAGWRHGRKAAGALAASTLAIVAVAAFASIQLLGG